MTVSPTVATVVIVLLYAMVIVLLIFGLIVIVLLYAILIKIVLLIVLLSGYAANRGRGLIVCSTYISYMLSMIQL